ncbi:MAG: hypothetical protein PHN42_05815 [Bacilli bacterium]|nr:hypothetical protein [Bacilli bacterium]
MKNIFKIHVFNYIIAFIFIINGYFKNYLYILIIILIHELGHIFGAYIFSWKIKKIVILPFGGITIFNELLNRKIKEELIIVMLGPLFQIIFITILNLKLKEDIITNYNIIILFMNLLPIIPLDGSKILNLITDYFFSYKTSYYITLICSIFCCIFFIIYSIIKFNLIFIIFIYFLLLKNIKEIKNKRYKYNKFILERYNYNLYFNKYKVIKNINKMKRDYKHIFIYNNKQYTEKEFLRNLFDNKGKIC